MTDSLFQVTFLSLFPEMFPGPLGYSLAKKALDKNIWKMNLLNIRDYAKGTNSHLIDDKAYGGGSGMVMRPDVLGNAIDSAMIASKTSDIIYMSPRGKKLDQKLVENIKSRKNIIIICGRFEGIDERIIEEYNIEEISIGDFVLSGGEIAAMTLIDAVVRLLPGVIENTNTLTEESFSNVNTPGLLEYPLYTRPTNWKERIVPEVLLSGNHQNISLWKKQKSEEITKIKRPDLWELYLKRDKSTTFPKSN